MSKVGLSKESQQCALDVERAPKSERQWVFERACQSIKDKTQIATLALILGLSTVWSPQVQAWEPQKAETTKLDAVINNPQYKRLLSTIDSEFPKLIEQWKKEVSIENQAKFEKYMLSMEKKLREWSLALKTIRVFWKMVDENWAFYINFHNYVAQFEPFAQRRTAEIIVNISQNRETISQNRETIIQLDKNIALLEALGKAAWKK